MLFEQLTPEQAWELRYYAAIEPFGEVRADYRTAAVLQQQYDIARGRKGQKLSLGEFVLYPDIAKATTEHKATQTLVTALDSMADKPKRKRKNGQ